MSKSLTKILTICILALIIPVAIVVTAICLSNAVTYTLTLAIDGFEENAGAITLKVNGKDYVKPVQISRNSLVTLSVDSTGYDFGGWFLGTADEISAEDKAISNEKSFTIKINEDLTLTAMNEIIVYSISYDEETATQVKYGSELKVIPDEDRTNGIVFKGWKMEGSEKVYRKALFGTEKDVALTSVQDLIKYNISYNGEEPVNIEFGTALKDFEDEDRENGLVFEGWKINGDETVYVEAKFLDYDENQVINLVSSQRLIKYNISYNGEEPVSVEFGTALKDFEDQDRENGLVFEGWKINGDETVYTEAKFLDYNENQVINLVSSQKNLFEGVVKEITVKYDFYGGPWYDEEGYIIEGEISHKLINSVKDDIDALEYNYDTETIEILLNELVKEVFDSKGKKYTAESITIVYGNSEQANIELTTTISEFLSYYKNLSGNDYTTGEIIEITLSYTPVTAEVA